MKRAHLFIYGDVIGVGYRMWMTSEAKKLGVTGWVKNTDRGVVAAEVQGEEEMVQRMVELCKKGPDIAWVEKVDTDWIDVVKDEKEFKVLL